VHEREKTLFYSRPHLRPRRVQKRKTSKMTSANSTRPPASGNMISTGNHERVACGGGVGAGKEQQEHGKGAGPTVTQYTV
jgi:hypothetical protein